MCASGYALRTARTAGVVIRTSPMRRNWVSRIRSLIADGFQLRTETRFQEWIKKQDEVKEVRISSSVLETLAIIAYKQPITRAGIEELRTVDSSYATRTLLERKLIKILGREEVPGRPILYGTTKEFLELFSFNKIEDLPRPEDFDIANIINEDEE